MPPDPAPLAGIAPFHPSNGSECIPSHELAEEDWLDDWGIADLLFGSTTVDHSRALAGTDPALECTNPLLPDQ
jgi:hypothetical protein